MSLCYSDTQSSPPPHWLKRGSDVKLSMSWGRIHVCNPPLTPPSDGAPKGDGKAECFGRRLKFGKGGSQDGLRILFWGHCIRQAHFLWELAESWMSVEHGRCCFWTFTEDVWKHIMFRGAGQCKWNLSSFWRTFSRLFSTNAGRCTLAKKKKKKAGWIIQKMSELIQFARWWK